MQPKLVYCDRSYLKPADAKISLFDGGYLYGDGVFTTLRLYRGHPYQLSKHLTRLKSQAAELAIDCPVNTEELKSIIDHLVVANSCSAFDCRARLTISRHGVSPCNLTSPSSVSMSPAHERLSKGTFSVILSDLPSGLTTWQQQGIRAVSAPNGLTRNALPHLKSLNFLTSQLALRIAHDHGCQEALFCDNAGNVLEGAVSNIFLICEQELLTPTHDLPLLAGLTRSKVMELGKTAGLVVKQQIIPTIDILSADEVFLTNAVREVVPVIELDSHTIGTGKPGLITRTLQKKYSQDVAGILAE